MKQRKFHIAAQAAGFAMVNQDSVDNQSKFFVRLDEDGAEISSPLDGSHADNEGACVCVCCVSVCVRVRVRLCRPIGCIYG